MQTEGGVVVWVFALLVAVVATSAVHVGWVGLVVG